MLSGGYALVSVPGLLIAVASLVVEQGLNDCAEQAYLPRGMWNLPGPGVNPLHWQVDC